ncbi:MAG: hypothetical protein P3B76_00895 [Gemmatimonadota bacterium]|nr:hypothetical protein [Gemmatimonadota bacterium]MDQ8171217.1 hypothetical protein [Gemmatimonadota bacterium]
MKQLIIPIVIGLLAGLGGGTGYSYMRTAAKYVADSTHLADSLKANPPADSAAAEGEHGAPAAHDSTATDSTGHGMDLPGNHEAAAPMTPADSIRALDAARHDAAPAADHAAPAKPAAKPAATPAAKPDAKPAAAAPAVTPKANTTAAAATVKDASNAVMQTALPEQRLAKIFSAMAAKDAAKVLEQMTDTDVRTILGMMSDRQAAAILSTFSASRAAAISRGTGKAPGGML